MDGTVTFPDVEPAWVFERDAVRFYALDGTAVVKCLVTFEALFSHFGVRESTATECLRAYHLHREVIQDAARRKLIVRPQSQNECVLTDTDFPTGTTTTQPPRVTPSVTTIDPALSIFDSLSAGVAAANAVITELGRNGPGVRVDWNLVQAPRTNLARLRVTDQESGASAEGLYTPADLHNASSARFSLLRVWDDMLREKIRRLTAASEAGA